MECSVQLALKSPMTWKATPHLIQKSIGFRGVFPQPQHLGARRDQRRGFAVTLAMLILNDRVHSLSSNLETPRQKLILLVWAERCMGNDLGVGALGSFQQAIFFLARFCPIAHINIRVECVFL